MKKLGIVLIFVVLISGVSYAAEQNRLPISIGNFVLQIINLQDQLEQINIKLNAA